MLKQRSASTVVASRRSLFALDAMNLFLADIEGGVGPYLSMYLRSARHWDQASIGVAVAICGIAAVLAQGPAGAMVDRLKRKRMLVTLAAIVVACGCLCLIFASHLYSVLAAQAAIGAAAAFLPPSIAAISLGLVGHAGLDKRIGRNEIFNHAGNLLGALVAATLGFFVSSAAIFLLMAELALLSAVSVLNIRGNEIDYQRARGGTAEHGGKNQPISVRELLKDRRILIFALAAVLFASGNAAMMPAVAQKVTDSHLINPAVCISSCIIVAQLTMVPTALFASRFAGIWGRKPVFLLGFSLLPLRGVLFAITGNPYLLIAIEILDGLSGGIFGVTWVLVTADLTRGTGRFNLTQGLIMAAIGTGTGLSNLLTGFILKEAGYAAGFLTLTAIGIVALLIFAIFMPETKDS